MSTSANIAQKTIEPTPNIRENTLQLSEIVTQALQQHFDTLKQESPTNLYKTMIAKVEIPLLQYVMEQYRYNQSRVAQVLGLSRGTLRTKLQQHFYDKYVGTRANKAIDEHLY